MAMHPITSYRESFQPRMTLEAFGDLVGVKKAAVSKWENGAAPSPLQAIEIEKATGIPRGMLRPDLWDAPSEKGAA